MRDLDSELYSLGLSAGEYIKYDGSNFVGDTPSSSNIGNSDLTVDSAGIRKLVLGGALQTDAFLIKNSADSKSYLTVNGVGNVYGSGPSGDNRNTAYGADALGAQTTGLFCVAVGNGAGQSITTQSYGTFVGFQAGSTMSGSDATCVGYKSALLASGLQVTSVGSNALSAVTSGNGHTAVGANALKLLPGGTTGSTALGNGAGQNVNTGVASASYGIFIGYASGNGVTTARENIFIGSGHLGACGITNGYENTVIGSGLTGLTNGNGQVILANGNNEFAIRRDTNGNIYFSEQSQIAAAATDGFVYLRNIAGAPTGTPTAITGQSPMTFDPATNNLYIYNGTSWVSTTLT
jgi:hypothetical protein